MKKIVKLAVIRDNENKPCPFGLEITEACKYVGKLIDQMIPIDNIQNEEEKEITKESNNRIYLFDDSQPRGICKYANYIFDKQDKVECNFGDYGAGKGHIDTTGSPMIGSYLGGAFYSVPLGFYNQSLVDVWDNFMNRTFANDEEDEFIKEANIEDNKKK